MDHLTASLLIYALPFPAAVSDPDLRILTVNAPGRIMLGLPPDSAPSQESAALLEAVPPNERATFEAGIHALRKMQASVVSHPAITFEVFRRTAHGERACQITAAILRDDGGANVGFLFSSPDFATSPDAHRRAEQEAARMEVARQLAATMNHEINNPLFVVSATLEDLLAEIDDPAEQRRLNAALEAVWRVSSAVKKLSEIRQLVTTAYIDGFPMIDLEASQLHPEESPSARPRGADT